MVTVQFLAVLLFQGFKEIYFYMVLSYFQVKWGVNVWCGILGGILIGPYLYEVLKRIEMCLKVNGQNVEHLLKYK